MSKFKNKYDTNNAKKYAKECGCELLSEEYLGMNEKHLFKCACGNDFTTTFAKFQNRNKRQCNKCGRKKTHDMQRLSIEYVEEYVEQFGCKVLDKEYVNYKTTIHMLCKCGKEFYMNFANFKATGLHQCQECTKETLKTQNCKYTYEEVSELLTQNGCTLMEEKTSTYINRKDKMKIKCSCGNIFYKSLEIMFICDKFQCNDCSFENAPNSKGEEYIKMFLTKYNISFREQVSFDDCKYVYSLRYDFGIYLDDELVCLIEYDGIQHFKAYDYYGGEEKLKIVKERDNIKNEYCFKNNIPLLRIPYHEFENIDTILSEYLSHMIIPSQVRREIS